MATPWDGPQRPHWPEPILPQSGVERCFPLDDTACTERARFAQAEDRESPFADGLYLKRGLVAGMLAERLLHRFGPRPDRPSEVSIAALLDRILAETRLVPLPIERVPELR